MKFGVFYELQLPKPWGEDDERKLVHDALAQVELADDLGLDYAWAVEHHFLEEYSHCSASEVFLAAAAARTKRIRLGHGIRQVIANYNHPARTAEAVAMLDLVSNGRAELGIGEGATRLELGGFGVPAKEKRAMALEAAEQIANMMVMTPYPGLRGPLFHDALPQRAAQTHAEAAPAHVDGLLQPRHHQGCGKQWPGRAGVLLHRRDRGAHLEPDLLRHHQKRQLRARRAQRQRQHRHGVGVLAASRPRGGRPARQGGLRVLPLRNLRPRHQRHRARPLAAVRTVPGAAEPEATPDANPARTESLAKAFQQSRGIGTPADFSAHVRSFEEAGVDQIILLQQAGRNRHEHICELLTLLGAEVLPEFAEAAAERERRKAAELAPYVEKALARKKRMPALADADIPVVRASVAKPILNTSSS